MAAAGDSAFNEKICKAKGDPSELEKEIARHLCEIEEAQVTADLTGMKLSRGTMVQTDNDIQVVLIGIPTKIFLGVVKKNQSRWIAELEKKLKKHVILYGDRQILKPNYKENRRLAKQFKIRPINRTLRYVHGAWIDDIVGPAEVVGKRLRYKADGRQLLKIHLDPKDKNRDTNLEDRLEAYSAAYKSLTNREAVFFFPEIAAPAAAMQA